MLSLDDGRWSNLSGGYRTRFDPRPLLAKIEAGQDTPTAWHALWEGLHHQGDVGEASYAAVPHLVRIHRKLGAVEFDAYAMVAIIELAREKGGNPQLPEWLEHDYFAAIRELAEIGAVEVFHTEDSEVARVILSVVAIAKGLRIHGKFLVQYSENELLDMESRA